MASLETDPSANDDAGFSVDRYLAQRIEDPNFTLVEIGHDSLPVAYMQPFEFRANRAYIGIEAWLRDPIGVKHEHLAETRQKLENGQNTFYIHHDVGGQVKREDGESWYEDVYEPATLLPDDLASEVLLSNVLGDPHIASSAERSVPLLAEATRLVDRRGHIILRETITPHFIRLRDDILQGLGLHADGFVDPTTSPEDWEKLEAIYKAEPAIMSPNPQDFYLFLRKTSP